MLDLIFLAYIAAFGFLNVGAGRKFWGLTSSTQLSRIIFAFGSATLATLAAFGDIWLFVGLAISLFIYRLPAWDFSAISGQIRPELPQNKVTGKLWGRLIKRDPSTLMEKRLFGTISMALRQALIIPAVAFFALMTGDYMAIITALAFPLMGGAYFLGGVPKENKYSVAVAEVLCGVIIAAMLWGY